MTTRRDFLKTLGVSAAGMAMGGMNTFASTLTSAQSASAKTDKVKIAYIGIGNRGEQNISEFAKTGMVASLPSATSTWVPDTPRR